MSKSVLISVNPKWCDKIASGEKTIEVRKTRPKIETPFKCYIYCTKPSYPHEDFIFTDGREGEIKGFYGGGKVIGEFVCTEIERYAKYGYALSPARYMKSSPYGYPATEIHYFALQLSSEELENYGKGAPIYGWRISDLKIYDEPKELTEFLRPCHNEGPCALCKYAELDPKDEILNCMKRVERPPQSWQFVEELK